MMRRHLMTALAVLAVAATALAGCGKEKASTTADDGGSTTAKIATPAPLTSGGDFLFCTDVPYPPAEYLEGSNFVGYEVDIAKELASRIGTTAAFQKTGFDGIIAALLAKKCDAIISSMNVTPEREKQVAFVEYLNIGQSLMVLKGKNADVAGLDDLAGKSVAVQIGTTLKDALDAKNKELEASGSDPIEIVSFPDADAAANALRTDKVDVFFADAPVVADYINKAPDEFSFAGEPIDPLPVGIALRPGDTELVDAVQEAMDAMYADGGMDEILEQWKISDFALAGDGAEDESDADGEDEDA